MTLLDLLFSLNVYKWLYNIRLKQFFTSLGMLYNTCSQSKMKAWFQASVALNGMLFNFLLSSWKTGATIGMQLLHI